MKKKNIVIYVSGFYYGGIEEFVTNVVSNISKENINISVLTRYAETSSAAYKKLLNTGISIYSFDIQHLSLRSVTAFYNKLNTYFKDNQIDFLHVNGLDEPFVLELAKKHGIKTAVHVHEPCGESTNPIKDIIKRFARKRNINNADYYFSCSNETGKITYAPFNISEYVVISNGIENKKFAYDSVVRTQLRKELGLDCITIAHVGRFTDVKNQSFIVDILNELKKMGKRYQLVLVGDGEDREKVEQRISAYQMDDQVKLLGERSDIHKLLQAFDVFIMPSKFEGLGISLLEAQSAGLRCFVSDNIPNEAIVTDLVTKHLLGAASVWAKAIDTTNLSYDRTVYSQIVGQSKYDIRYTCEQLEAIYAE